MLYLGATEAFTRTFPRSYLLSKKSRTSLTYLKSEVVMQARTCHLRIRSQASYHEAIEAVSRLILVLLSDDRITAFIYVKETAMAGLEPSTFLAKSQHGALEPSRLRDVVVSKLV